MVYCTVKYAQKLCQFEEGQMLTQQAAAVDCCLYYAVKGRDVLPCP
jgi:hypothetical protein